MALLYWEDPHHPEYGSDEIQYDGAVELTDEEHDYWKDKIQNSNKAKEYDAASSRYNHVLSCINAELDTVYRDYQTALERKKALINDYETKLISNSILTTGSAIAGFFIPPMWIGTAAAGARTATLQRPTNEGELGKCRDKLASVTAKLKSFCDKLMEFFNDYMKAEATETVRDWQGYEQTLTQYLKTEIRIEQISEMENNSGFTNLSFAQAIASTTFELLTSRP